MNSKLEQFLMQLSINDIMYNEYEGNIYHYTSPNGLHSILFGDMDNVDNQKEIQKNILRILLQEKGYMGVAKYSKIPVRY